MSNSQNIPFTLIYQTQSDQYFICLYTPIIKKYMHQNNKTTIRRIRRRRGRRGRGRRLNQALYYLDFCWCMNFTGMLFIGMLLLAGQNVDDATRRALFSGKRRWQHHTSLCICCWIARLLDCSLNRDARTFQPIPTHTHIIHCR